MGDRKITVDQAMRCAKREPGRSWEALETELNKLGQSLLHGFLLTYHAQQGIILKH